MLKPLAQLITALEEKMKIANKEGKEDGIPRLAALEIRLLGQFGLMVQEEISDKLKLNRTQDVDAIVKSDIRSKRLFIEALTQLGYIYDELSNEIWIPADGKFNELYNENNLNIQVLDYLSILVSKAVKAPEKNRQLITAAIAALGEPLVEKIIKNGGDIEYFIK